MLKEICASILPGLPYLAAILAGGLIGRFVYDRRLIKAPVPVFVITILLILGSIIASGLFLEHGPRLAMLIFNAISGGGIAFACTAFGGFEESRA